MTTHARHTALAIPALTSRALGSASIAIPMIAIPMIRIRPSIRAFDIDAGGER